VRKDDFLRPIGPRGQSDRRPAADRLAFSNSLLHRSPLLGGLFAAALVALGLLLRAALGIPPGDYPFLTFFPAVAITAVVAGARPAVACAVASLVIARYYFVPPFHSFGLTHSNAAPVLLFAIVVGIIVHIVDALGRAVERLKAEQKVSFELIEQQNTIFAELQHRVANNLAFLSGLLVLAKKQIIADPSVAPRLLDDAVERLELMSRMHRRLHDPEALARPVSEYLQELCADLLTVTGAQNIVCLVEADDIRLDLTRLTTLSLLLVELMTNSLKHAFKQRDGGTIQVRLNRLPNDLVALEIDDGGPGMSPERQGTPNGGLGLRIVRSLATQLAGDISPPGGGAALTRVVFPA
jgi:two-component sensor histidine kinase